VKDFLRNNGLQILIIALLLTLITAVVSLLFGGAAAPVSNLAGIAATPFRNAFNAFVRWSEKVYTDQFELQSMKDELEYLRRENAALKSQAMEGEAASRENERLRTLLGLKEEHPEYELEDAKVTARDSSNWTSTLTVNKGSSVEVEAGDCVIDQYGYLVGVICEAGLNWSKVRTVVDVDLEMGALIARTDVAAILEGDFELMGQGKLKLTYLPEDTQILPGDTILTSGLRSGDRATYPSGLVAGYVEEVRIDESGMNDYAVLTPASSLDHLEQVFIIKSFTMAQ